MIMHDDGAPEDHLEIVRRSLAAIDAVLRRAEAVPLSAYEEREAEGLLPLVQETRAVLDAATETVSAILRHYDALADMRASQLDLAPAAPASGELCGEVERVITENVGIRRIQNLAYIARLGMRARATALGADPGKWELIGLASSALREVMKALGALAVVVCAHEGLPEPETFYVTELERSLAIRHAYRIFYADVAPWREPTPAELPLRLRRAANAIAKLVGRPVYASMRVHDRFSLRATQHKLRDWLAAAAGASRAVHEAAGLRLFQDLAHLAELMQAVNERAELREHDARVIDAQIAALETGSPVLGPVARALGGIAGRDPQLDRLLSNESPPSTATLLARLREIRRLLAPSAGPAPTPRPGPGALDHGDDFI